MPDPGPDFDLPAALTAIRTALPGVALDDPQLLGNGFDSIAIATPSHIFRFPQDADSAARMRTEVGLLRLIRQHVDLPVPDLTFHDDAVPFSSHPIIPGDTLMGPDYLKLNDRQRDELAQTLAVLYAQLHAIPLAQAQQAGATAVEHFPDPDTLQASVRPLLSDNERDWADRTIALWRDLPPDEHRVFSWFDGHGWNMAFDHQAGRLNGVFDFADAGIGPMDQDLIITNLIHPDLTRRLVQRYANLTGISPDPRRLAILTGIHRLADLVSSHDHPQFGQLTRDLLQDWLSFPDSQS